jgi:hypothetical protein
MIGGNIFNINILVKFIDDNISNRISLSFVEDKYIYVSENIHNINN